MCARLSQMIWNDKLLQCAQIIRKYPLEEREEERV